jgi:UDPglucose 6-dehydrogenase
MLDIKAPDFADRFDREKACVGVIGQGFVGGSIKAYFMTHGVKVQAYDKFKPEFGSLADVVKLSDIIFVCVPTPMRKTSECYTGIVEAVFKDIIDEATLQGRPLDSFVVCIKSTVTPGFTDAQREKTGLRLVFSPEFLTEANAVNDMLNANRVVIGGPMEDARIVLHFFLEADKERVSNGECVLVQCTAKGAEMTKLTTNGLLFSKVLFLNEVYQLCQKMGIDYDEVRVVTSLDSRVGHSHMLVPGPDKNLGAGGHCFPKDMNNLKYLASQLGVPERMFTAVLVRNGEVRREADWEKMTDRAVTDK